MGEETIHEGPHHSVQVEKNSRGYNYVIKVSSEDIEYVKAKVTELEAWCKERFQGEK